MLLTYLIEMLSATSFQRAMMKMYSLGKYRNKCCQVKAATIPISDRKTKCFFVHVLILQMKHNNVVCWTNATVLYKAVCTHKLYLFVIVRLE